jgi:hypothetical protein
MPLFSNPTVAASVASVAKCSKLSCYTSYQSTSTYEDVFHEILPSVASVAKRLKVYLSYIYIYIFNYTQISLVSRFIFLRKVATLATLVKNGSTSTCR